MAKRKKEMTPITKETTLRNARQWLNIIRYHESGTVIQLQDDGEYRVLEILNNPAILKQHLGPYHRKYLLKYIQIDQQDFDTALRQALLQLCFERKILQKEKALHYSTRQLLEAIAQKGFDVGLFLSHVTPLFAEKHFQPFFDLEFLVRTAKNLSVIVFSELDITEADYRILADKSSFLFDHVITYPLYGEKDSMNFAAYYTNQWNTPLSPTTVQRICDACGGYLWLIHQAVRTLRDSPESSPEDVFENELFMRKLEVIWTKCTKTQQTILTKSVKGTLTKEDMAAHEYRYLLAIGMLKDTNGKISIGIPLLSRIIEKEKQLSQLHVRNGVLFIADEAVTPMLTKKEHILLTLFVSRQKQLIPREDIAKALWQNVWQEKYSDWAIDRLLYRLRAKLTTLGIDTHLLKTVKRRGVSFG